MKKYISILLAAVLSASLLAGCGGSGNSGQQPAAEAKEETAQPEEKEAAEPAADAAQTDTAQNQDAAQTQDAAQNQNDAAQAQQETNAQGNDANAGPAAGFYQIHVIDAATMDPIEGARVQFCSDTACMMGITDINGLASFESDPGNYTVHLLKAPKGYKGSTEEFTLTADSREATYQLEKEEAAAETAAAEDNGNSADSQNTDNPKLQAEWDCPNTGFTFSVPESFKDLIGDVAATDRGEIQIGSGVVEGYIVYLGRTNAEIAEFEKTIGEISDDGMTDEQKDAYDAFISQIPTIAICRVIGLGADKDKSYLNEYYTQPIKVCEELGTGGDYTFYYVVLDFTEEYWNWFRSTYPEDRFNEFKQLWEEAGTTDNFRSRITVKAPEMHYTAPNEGAISFETVDLEGNPVTSKELFADHKITMINIWATWCTHCVRELPELEKMSKEWAEQDCQIIGICDDAEDDEMAAAAIKILEKNGVTYRNIRSTEELRNLFKFTSLPTSYYVNSEGVVLDYPIKGAMIEVYPEKLQELLSNLK